MDSVTLHTLKELHSEAFSEHPARTCTPLLDWAHSSGSIFSFNLWNSPLSLRLYLAAAVSSVGLWLSQKACA